MKTKRAQKEEETVDRQEKARTTGQRTTVLGKNRAHTSGLRKVANMEEIAGTITDEQNLTNASSVEPRIIRSYSAQDQQ